MDLSRETLALLPVWYLAFLISLTWHEAAHALVGKIGGDLTAAEQVTLNPIPHMRREPFGTILFPLLSYFLQGGGWMVGWASAPYNPTWADRYPRRAALMATAGPVANFALALLAGVGMIIGVSTGHFTLPDQIDFEHLVVFSDGSADALSAFLSIMFSINVVLGSFNLIPIPPLDGFAIAPLVMSDSLRHKWFELGRGLSWAGIFIAWFLFAWLFPRVFSVALGALYHAMGSIL